MHMNHVYLLDISTIDPQAIDQYITGKKFPESTAKRLGSIKNYRVKTQVLFSHLLLVYAIKHTYSLDISDYEEEYNENGKPRFQGAPFAYNISHSHDLVVVALSDEEIGIDIELDDAKRQISPNLAKKVLSSSEYVQYVDLPPVAQRHLFYRRWVQLESYLKFCGTGLLNHLYALELDESRIRLWETVDNNQNTYFISVYTNSHDKLVIQSPQLIDVLSLGK